MSVLSTGLQRQAYLVCFPLSLGPMACQHREPFDGAAYYCIGFAVETSTALRS